MATETRYLFENDFDNPDVVESTARVYSEDDLQAARAEAQQLVRNELHDFEEKRAANVLAEISAKLDALSAQRAANLQSASESAVEIAVAMCRKALPTLAAQGALTEIEGHIARTLNEVHGEPRVVVRAAEQNIASLQAHIDTLTSGFDGEIVVLADDQLAATDCHVMWADGGSERDVQRTRSEIDKAVEQITSTGIAAVQDDPAVRTDQEIISDSPESIHDFNYIQKSSQVID